MNQTVDRLPPHNLEAEAAVLGACLMDPLALDLALTMMKPENFYKGAHRAIFEAVMELADRPGMKGEGVDMVTVMDLLQDRRQLELAGGPMGLAALSEKVASATNVESYINLVLGKYRLRELIAAAGATISDAYARAEEPSLVIDAAEAKIFDIGADQHAKTMYQVGTGWEEEFRRLEKISRSGRTTGIPTGFKELDRITGGWQPGRFVVIAARPGIGKTAWALNSAVHVAGLNVPTAFFSPEMPVEEMRSRIVCSLGRIDSEKLLTNLTPNELKTYAQLMNAMRETPLFLNDDGDLHLENLVSQCRMLVRRHGVRVIFVDYLQLLSARGFKPSERVAEVTKISKTLKAMAKTMKITMVVMSQFNRESVKTGQTRPQVQHLRDSGSIEQDADVIIIMDPDTPGDPKTHFHLDKHRGGPTGHFFLDFEKPWVRFVEPTPTLSTWETEARR